MASSVELSQNLIRTKLHRPAVTPGLVRRDQLCALLNSGRGLPLTLVSAPAGSGKTTLLSAWLEECSCPSAWVSLDERDGDLPVFIRYFVAAIRSIFPDACSGAWALFDAPEFPPPQTVATQLVNEIDSLVDEQSLGPSHQFVLVLDDYHLVLSQAVHTFLTELLRYPAPVMRLALATRSDPALPLAALRARGQLLEVRYQDLRFSHEETKAFLRKSLNSGVSVELASSLEARTEGWIAGLHLAALSLRHEPHPDKMLADREGSDHFTTDFLVDEVLSRQPQAMQEFLLKTSVLDRLCAPLCAAVMGSGSAEDGQAYLERLVKENLFVVALDEQGTWFRYHHLFRQLLRNRFLRQYSPDELAALHGRASAWFAGVDLVDEAIAHGLASGDESGVVRLVEANRHAAMNQERWLRLDHWLHLLPRRLVDAHVELLLLEAWILQTRWRFADLPALLDHIDALMARTPPPEPAHTHLRGEIDTLRSVVSYYRVAAEDTYVYATRALETVPVAYSTVRGWAWIYVIGAHHLKGDFEGAISAFHEALKEDRLHGDSFPSRPLLGVCLLYWMTADLWGMLEAANHLLGLATERHLPESAGWAHYFQGCVYYQWNDLAAAEREFAWVVEQRYMAHSAAFFQGVFGLASVYMAQGAFDRAQSLMEFAMAHSVEMSNRRVLLDAQAFKAYLALRMGRSDEALQWAERFDFTAPIPALTTFHVVFVSLAKILLAAEHGRTLELAAEVLDRLEARAATTYNTRFLAEAQALQALLHDRLGEQEAAVTRLEQSLVLAQPGGLVRLYVDLGPRMAALLARLRQRGVAPGFIDQVLGAMGSNPPAIAAPATAVTRSGPVEPLTPREVAVLELLAQRLSDKEIAASLFISERTARRHAANIYQKLGVANRREAVAEASALGILA